MLLEIACFNLESGFVAQKAGANRIEFCQNYSEGGITPSKNFIQEARTKINIELYVMMRPHSNNFIYTVEEFIQMQESIVFCKENKCDGFVFGILNELGEIDKERCKKLVELAKPLPCTFHRAFDECKNPEKSLEDVIACGFKRILTSGANKDALEGASNIKNLITQAKNRIVILPGGGIRSTNISEIIKLSGANEFHTSAITNNSEIANELEIKSILNILQKY